MALCDVFTARIVHQQIHTGLCALRPLLRGSAALPACPQAGITPFQSLSISQASTSVQQPLHPVFEITQVAVAFPGVLSQFQVLEVGEWFKRCPFQPTKPVSRER